MKTGTYTFHIKLEEAAALPAYKGSTFRGVLGHALKQMVCVIKHQECNNCILKSACLYALVFETGYALPRHERARVSSVPHPMVIVPPLTVKKNFRRGDTLSCDLLLFGEINRNVPYFIYAFKQMGKIGIGKHINGQKARFSLEKVTHRHDTIYQKNQGQMTLPDNLIDVDLLPVETFSSDRVEIRIITPLRIIVKTQGPPALPFSDLIRSFIRRNTALLNTWGNGEPDLDYSTLTDRAKKITILEKRLFWFDWQRYSSRQEKKMFMGGLTGQIVYQGDIAPFIPLLRMAEIVHAGKNTAFGLGKITFKILHQ